MPVTRQDLQVQWAAADDKAVAAGTAEESDLHSVDASCVNAQISLKANNTGTPADGDTVDVYLLQSSGDTDNAANTTDEHDTPAHARHLFRLDTHDTGDGDNPARVTVLLPIPQKNFKLRAVSNAGTNSITVSAKITEQRAS